MKTTLAIGVDLGATKIATALVTSAGEVLADRQIPTEPETGMASVINRLASEVGALLNSAHGEVLGIGIGSPGLVDHSTGNIINAVNLGWDVAPLAKEIRSRIPGLPVFIENDANAAAIGEGMFGSARDTRDYVLLTVGSGLGSGIVSDGRLITGAHNMAADLGHISLDPDNGLPCVCGRRGCAETIISGPGLLALTRRSLVKHVHTSRLLHNGDLTTADVLSAARQGDALARQSISLLGNWLGQIAAIASAVLDPDVVIIGGGLGIALADLVTEDVARELGRRLPSYQKVPAIRPSTLASSALGSASLVWSRLGEPRPLPDIR